MFTLTCKFCDSIFVVVIREIKRRASPSLFVLWLREKVV